MRKLLLSLTILGLFALAFVPTARADTTSFDINTGNSAISGYTGPYVHVEVNRTSTTTATITFTSQTVGGYIFLMGGNGAVALDVNASSWTLGTMTASNSGTGFTPGSLSDGGSAQEDGFGTFNQTIDSFDGATHSSDKIVINITNTGGTWSTADAVLNDAAAHIFVFASPAVASAGAVTTGYGGTHAPVPEPASLFLLGLGLAGLGGIRLRRNKKEDQA